MFGHSELGSYSFGEYPTIRTTFAILARVVIVPAVRITARVKPTLDAVFKMRPK